RASPVRGGLRVVSQQRRRHGRRMRRYARAEIEGDVVEVIARSRRAIRAALLQAGDMRISKVPAARTLREVAAKRREVTDLRRRQALRGRCDSRIRRGNAR